MKDHPRFWLVTAASTARDCWVRITSPETDPVGESVMERLLADQPLDGPLELTVWNRGPRRGDLLWTGGGTFSAVSERAVGVLESIGATGWRSVPATTRFANGDPLTGYHVLVVTGRSGELFGQKRRPDRPGVDPSQGWDGSDVFAPNGRPHFTFCVTHRVREAFDAAGLERVVFRDPARYGS
ncbi:hypothetical protein GCM10023340_39340 [Nocardioides marinquilinus]|uniref:Uncharacterized protein n=1 Tax=Nocardioides marinquilinus TaxID=1210400 RepID=A0ABP9Q1G7_9ACTN